jgi:copper chaperone CopZ
MTPVEQITALYIGYFGRAPEPAGLNYWVGRLQDGFSLAEIAESFSVQPESTTKYPYLANPNISSPATFITQIYLNLFNRAPDAAGLAYWTAQLEGGADVGSFILDVISGAQGTDKIIIDNKIEVGADFALEASNQPGFVYDADAANAAVEVINGVNETDASVAEGKAETDAFLNEGPAPTVSVLTTAIDNIAGTAGVDQVNGVFDGAATSTFNTGDTINGGAGEDTLSLIVTSGAAVTPGSITNVENISIQAISNVNIDMSNASGVEEVELRGVNNGFVSLFNLGEVVDAVFTNTNTDVGLYYDASVTSGSTDVQNVSVINSDGVFIDSTGVETLAITATGESALGFQQNDIETVTVAGAGNLEFNNSVNVDTFDASASTGDVNVDFGGADQVVTGGAGADTFDFGGSLQSADTVSGGAGNDTVLVDISGNLSSAAQAARFNALTGIERVGFNGNGVTLNGATFTNTAITALRFDTTGDDVIDNAGSARTYQFGRDNTGSADFNMNGTSTVLNIELRGQDNNDSNIDDLNVTLSGVQPTSAVSTINIDSQGGVDDTAINNLGVISARAGSTINITGDGNTDIDGLAARGTINAASSTGDLTVEGSQATLATVVDAALSGADVITLGSGQDLVWFNSGLDSGAANGTVGAPAGSLFVDVINGFTAGDDGDVLNFNGPAGTYGAIDAADQNAINLLAGANATQQNAADIAANNATADEWTAFTFQGQTYALFNNDGDADYNAGVDVLVQLTGVTIANLTDANFA